MDDIDDLIAVWLDCRTESNIKQQQHDLGINHFRPKTGLPISTYFSSSKIQWLLENVEGASNPNTIIGTVDSFILWVR